MKAQWQIIDIDTGLAITVGRIIELVDFCKRDFNGKTKMSWFEATILFGNPLSTVIPRGIIKGTSPIEAAKKQLNHKKGI